MGNTPDWNELHDHLEQLLPHGLDETTWQALQRHSPAFVADELLWRVEAIARQVPAQGTISLQPIVRNGHASAANLCHLCTEQPGSGRGQRCIRCIAAITLVLGFPLLLDDAGLIEAHEAVVLDAQDERVVSNLFEM